MTYAPQSLLDARAYLQAQTGLPWVSLGIVGSDGHHRSGTSYHIGWSHLRDWAYSRQHPRDTRLRTEAASALDIGDFPGLVALTAHLVREARAGRLPDVREIIGPAADGRAYRWAAEDGWTPRQRARGDSHETHTHVSYYRDSEHRPKVQPFRRFFEGDDVDLNDTIEINEWMTARWPSLGQSITVRTALASGYGQSRLTQERTAELLAGQAAILAKVGGEDVAEAVRTELDRHRVMLLAELGEDLGQDVAQRLTEVPAERTLEAVTEALRARDLRAAGEAADAA